MSLASLLSNSIELQGILKELVQLEKYMTPTEKARAIELVTAALKATNDPAPCPCTDSECRLEHICDCDRDAWQHQHLVSDHNGYGRQL